MQSTYQNLRGFLNFVTLTFRNLPIYNEICLQDALENTARITSLYLSPAPLSPDGLCKKLCNKVQGALWAVIRLALNLLLILSWVFQKKQNLQWL